MLMDANNKKRKKTVIQTFHPRFSKLNISQTIDISCFLFQFEPARSISVYDNTVL